MIKAVIACGHEQDRLFAPEHLPIAYTWSKPEEFKPRQLKQSPDEECSDDNFYELN